MHKNARQTTMKRKQLESTPPEQEPEAERLQTEQFRLLQETATTASQYRDSGHVEPMQRQSPRRQSVEPDPYVSHSTAGDLAAAAGAYQLSLQHEAPEHLPFDQPATSPDRDQQQQMSQLLADQTYASIALGSTELGQRAYQDSLAEPCIPSSRSSRKSRAAAVPVGAFPCQCCKKARHFETLEALELVPERRGGTQLTLENIAPKSNTDVCIATIASRIRTRRNDIRIRSIVVCTRGHVCPCLRTRRWPSSQLASSQAPKDISRSCCNRRCWVRQRPISAAFAATSSPMCRHLIGRIAKTI